MTLHPSRPDVTAEEEDLARAYIAEQLVDERQEPAASTSSRRAALAGAFPRGTSQPFAGFGGMADFGGRPPRRRPRRRPDPRPAHADTAVLAIAVVMALAGVGLAVAVVLHLA